MKSFCKVIGYITLMIVIAHYMTPAVKGRPFITAYLCLAVFGVVAAKVLEWKTTFLIFLLEVFGGARIYFGYQAGMRNFSLLISIMIIEMIVVYFLINNNGDKGSGGGGSSSGTSFFSGGSSGCSGGCSGGCGGCGGD